MLSVSRSRRPERQPRLGRHWRISPLGLTLLVCSMQTQALGNFVERAADVGLVGTSQISQVFPILGGGAVGDINGDGWPDVFFPSGGNGPDKLFVNQRDGTFVDEAADWGIDLTHLSASAAIADYDGDGRQDIFVLSFGAVGNPQPGHHRLYRNTGTGFLEQAQSAGVATTSTSVADGWSASWGDYDLDGDLDLAVAGYRLDPTSNRLFRNNGDGTFADVTESAGLSDLEEVAGFAPVFVDMDGVDGPELIWIGDFSTSMYFVNNGDGTFRDTTPESGTSLDNSEMGVAVGDWNMDGRFDFYVSTIGTNNLYLNQGDNVFVNVADEVSVATTGWGWGVTAMDIDNDASQDIIVANQESRNFAFLGAGTEPLVFVEDGLGLGFGPGDDGRGMAELDADRDGDQDLVVFTSGKPLRYFENRVPPAGNRWLAVELERAEYADVPPGGIGAKVQIRLGNRWLSDLVSAGNGYMSQGEAVAHFGLGPADRVDELRVEWPNGHVTRRFDLEPDQRIRLQAGDVMSDGFE